LQYFSKKKLVLPEGYFVNSSQIPLAKEVNKLLANCGCETFPIKPLSEAIQKSNFFFTIQSELKNKIKIEGFEKVAMNLSISETALRGGDLDWVSENAISEKFKSKIINTPIGNISEPILLPEGILFFKVRDKRKLKKIVNLEDAKNQLVKVEKTKILRMHSLSHYKNLRKSITVNYY